MLDLQVRGQGSFASLIVVGQVEICHAWQVQQNTIVTSAEGKPALTNSFFARLLFSLNKLKFLMHTTLDPYNTTEEVELALTDAQFDWTNAGVLKCGVSNLRYDQVIHHTP